MMKNKPGQNVIEYVLLLVLIIVVLVVALGPNGIFTEKVKEALNVAVDGIKNEALGN